MARKNGLDYLELKIDDSGVIPTKQSGFGYTPGVGKFERLELQSRNRSPYVGDLVGTYDDLSGADISRDTSQEQISEMLYNTQSGGEMLVNSLLGMAAIAGTTYVSGTVGVANSLVEWSWDNYTNNAMAQLEEEARQRNQIYRPSDYDDWSLGQKIANGVFWADLLQNFGFTVGSGLAMATWAGVGNAIPGVAGVLSKAPAIVQKVAPSLMGAFGEGAIEAIHHKDEEIRKKSQIASEEFNKLLGNALTPETEELLLQDYGETLQDIEQDAIKGGNFVYGANLALLTLSNSIQFGDYFSRGFSTGRRVANTATRSAARTVSETGEDLLLGSLEKEAKSLTVAKGLGKGLINATSESGEEGSQYVITKAASLNSEYDSFNNSKFNPKKREEVTGMMESLMKSFSQSLHDTQFYTEMAMGFFTGLIGMPTRNGIKGGIIGEMTEAFQDAEKFNDAVDRVNQRLQEDSALNEYYNGLVRHLAYQEKENEALENDDHKAFADANSAKFISDIIMFDKVGRLDMLENIIDTASNLSNEEIQSLIQETSKDNEGPFLRNGNPMSSQEVQSILKEKSTQLKDKISSYVDIKDRLIQKFPMLSDDSLEQAIFYNMQIMDLDSRSLSMGKELIDLLKNIAKKEAFLPNEESKNLTADIASLTPSTVWAEITGEDSPLLDKINSIFADPVYGISSDVIERTQSLVDDFIANRKNTKEYVKSLNEIYANPVKENQKHESFRENLKNKHEQKKRQVETQKKANDIIESSAGTLASQFLEGSLEEDDAIDALEEFLGSSGEEEVKKVNEASRMAQATRNQIGTASSIGIIDTVDASEEAKQDAKTFVIYANKNADSTSTLLDESTYVEMTEDQIADALGIDLGSFNGEELEEKLQEIEYRKAQALTVLSNSIKQGIDDMLESDSMSASIKVPENIEQIGNDPITPVVDNSTKTIVNKAVPQPKTKASEGENSDQTKEISNWTSGLSYRYFGKEKENYGKQHLLVLKKRIEELTAKENNGSISEEEKTLLLKSKEDFATLRYMINQNVFSASRQKMVQPGTKLNFLIPAEFPTSVFISVTGADGLQYIVGNIIKSNIATDVLARKAQKNETGDYVEYNVSTVKEKKIGSLDIVVDQIHLQEYNQDFILGIDLSTQGSTLADIRTLPNSKVGDQTEEEESIRQPIKSNGGNVYVLVGTSDEKTKYIVAKVVSDTYDQEQSAIEGSPAEYLQQVVASSASLQEKLTEIQEILDIDVRTLYESQELGTTNKDITCKITSKGTWEKANVRTVYGEITASEQTLPQEILKLVSGKARYTVSRKYINSTIGSRDYNQMMGMVLSTNLSSLETVGDWFTMEPISSKTKISQIAQIKREPTVATVISSNKTIVENKGVNYVVDTSSWNVYKDDNGQRTLINSTQYNDDVYKALADALLDKQGKPSGVHATPWGVYDSSNHSFMRGISAVDLETLSPILSGLSAKRASEKIQALVMYDALPRAKKTAALASYVLNVEDELYVNSYSYDTKNVLQHQWDSGNRDHIEVESEVQDDTLEPGVEIIDSIIQASVYRGTSPEDIHPTLLQKAKVVIRKNTIQKKEQQESEGTTLNTIENPIRQKIDKLGFSHVFDSLYGGNRGMLLDWLSTKNPKMLDRIITKEMTTLLPMDVSERNDYVSSITEGIAPFRRTDAIHTKILDIQKELRWLHKVLPQTKEQDRVRILKGLIKIANSSNNETAWGMFKNGIIYIVENSAEGTVYHEAFHFVTHVLMSEKELNTLYAEAKKQYNTDDVAELEELLAEDFRRYITYDMTENQGILKAMWRNIKLWIKELFGNMTYIEKVYRNINNGLYAHRITKESYETKYRKLTENESLQTKSPETLQLIRNAHTIYKKENEELKDKLRKLGASRSYLYDTAQNFLKSSPNGEKLAYIKEDRGKYRIMFYSDMATLKEVRLEESIREEIENNLRNTSSKPTTRMSYQEYVNELAYLEEQIANLTEEEKMYSEEGYEYSYFKERERQLEKSLEFSNLSDEERQALADLKISERQYEALTTAEKSVLFYCLGL